MYGENRWAYPYTRRLSKWVFFFDTTSHFIKKIQWLYGIGGEHMLPNLPTHQWAQNSDPDPDTTPTLRHEHHVQRPPNIANTMWDITIQSVQSLQTSGLSRNSARNTSCRLTTDSPVANTTATWENQRGCIAKQANLFDKPNANTKSSSGDCKQSYC